MLIALLLLAMQYRSGAFTADMASDADEPAHATTSLMVRDYLVQALPHNPLAFARTFYAHYSKVAIGHWPPLFYCGEALWMLVAGRSRAALLLFVWLCGAALVCSVFLEVQRRSSTAAALASAALLMRVATFREMLASVHPDLLLALLVFWATVYCGEAMRSEARRGWGRFAAFAIAALLVHGRAAVLLLLPFSLLPFFPGRSRWRWLAGGSALLVGLQLLPLMGQSSHQWWASALPHARLFFDVALSQAGWLGSLLAAAGLLLVLREGGERQFWAAMAMLAVCGLAFYVLVPVPWDDRYLIPTLSAMAVLAGGAVQVGLERIASLGEQPRRVAAAAVMVGALACMGAATVRVEAKPNPGYAKMIAGCLLCGNDVSLVAGDPMHEGDLITEASLSDPERAHTVLRASKVLAQMSWSGYGYRMLYSSPAQVLGCLDRAHVSLVVIQNGYGRADVTQLRSALGDDTGEWAVVSGSAAGDGVTVFRRLPSGSAGPPRGGPE